MPKHQASTNRNGALSVLCSLLVVWGASFSYHHEISLARILLALAGGVVLILIWLQTADFGSRLTSAFICCTGWWLIGYAVGMSMHSQLTPLLS